MKSIKYTSKLSNYSEKIVTRTKNTANHNSKARNIIQSCHSPILLTTETITITKKKIPAEYYFKTFAHNGLLVNT